MHEISNDIHDEECELCDAPATHFVDAPSSTYLPPYYPVRAYLCCADYGALFGREVIDHCREGGVPDQYWRYHALGCGTVYRGCAPNCPKDNYERTGEWIWPELGGGHVIPSAFYRPKGGDDV